MASLLEEDLTSLDKEDIEDIFIADTTKLAHLFFEIQRKRKVGGQHAQDSKQFKHLALFICDK